MRLPVIMGTLIFLAGLVLVVLAALTTVVPVSTFGDAERFLLFGAGVLTLVIGNYMSERA